MIFLAVIEEENSERKEEGECYNSKSLERVKMGLEPGKRTFQGCQTFPWSLPSASCNLQHTLMIQGGLRTQRPGSLPRTVLQFLL